MTPVGEFCEKRRMGKMLTDAFTAYCRSYLADSFCLQDGETVTSLMLRMKTEDIEKIWGRFVVDLKDVLSG